MDEVSELSGGRKRFAKLSSLAVFLIAAFAAVNWIAYALFDAGPAGPVLMRPATALLTLAAAAALFYRAAAGETRSSAAVLAVVGAFVLAGAGYVVSSYTFGHSNLTDGLLLSAETSDRAARPHGNRMPLQAALNFILIGASLLLLGLGGRWLRWGSHLARLSAFFTIAVALGILYQATEIGGYADDGVKAAACITALFLLACSTLALNRRNRQLEVFLSDSLGGVAARRLLPVVVLVPMLIGWAVIAGQQYGLHSAAVGTMWGMLMIVILMFSMVTFYSRKVHKADLERRRGLEEIAEKENRYRRLFEYNRSILSTHDIDGRITAVNPAFLEATGYSESEVIGKSYKDFTPEQFRIEGDAYLRQVVNYGEAQGLATFIGNCGKRLVWEYRNILITEEGKEPYVMGSALDVTHHLKLQRQLEKMSLTDELTGLLNRRGFMTLAEQQLKLEAHSSTARGLALMFADMDGLKHINDTLGHDAGSEALRILASVMRSVVRSSDLVARWGGDEFVILTAGADDRNVDAMAARIEESLETFNATCVKPFEVRCSIGTVAVDTSGGKTLEDLIAEADAAMYAVKKRRRAALGQIGEPVKPRHEEGGTQPGPSRSQMSAVETV